MFRALDEIVAPRRAAVNRVLTRGVACGGIRPDVDPELVSDVRVAPILARTASGSAADSDPEPFSRAVTDLVVAGLAPRVPEAAP